ncbi:hypothetical protein [Rhodopila sp.]|uniref:hypothetical protein n=1 Tax=Rhodopila sp. TaxID=2480087 RepID=UPI003D0C1F29
MSRDEKPPAAKAHRTGTPGRLLGFGAALVVLRAAAAVAFPLIDPTNENQVPTGTELATPDAQDLQHQLQIVNGLAAPPDGGWTFVPRLDVQELLTDNVLQQHTPRRWDMVTYVAPGFSVAADTPRLQLSFSYAPTLALYARTGSLNALTQQFAGTGLVTVIPELAYVDVRAVSGVQSLYGGIGGLKTIGAAPAAVGATAATIPSLAGNGLGLNKDNEVQTSSFGVSPYLLRRFGDWGTGKIGYSVNVTESNLVTGFAPPPFPTGGANGQSLISNEEIAHFATGEFLGRLQDSIDADLTQSSYNTGTNYPTDTTGPLANNNNTTSTRALFSDQVSYVLNRGITVFASGGHEDISYTNSAYPHINDLTWSFGTTLTPNADSLLTVSYGHLNGFNSFTASGHYAVTARTVLTVSYGSTLGTQLENVQNQLNLASTGSGGSLVNAQTGGPLFGSTNALGVQAGVFRTDTLTLGGQTTLARDILSANLLLTKQSQQNGRTVSPTTADTITLQWIHQIHPDLTLSSAVAYSLQQQETGIVLNPGNSRSVAASVALQYQISDTLSASLRYSLFDRQSAVTAYQVYQNLLILGISKTF